MKFKYLLLVFTGDLGVRNDERWYQGVCLAAETASDTLDDKCQEQPNDLEMPLIMAIKDQSATATTLAFHHVRLQAEYKVVVFFL